MRTRMVAVLSLALAVFPAAYGSTSGGPGAARGQMEGPILRCWGYHGRGQQPSESKQSY
jgi:hypothetical protein